MSPAACLITPFCRQPVRFMEQARRPLKVENHNAGS
jgi:hypothetical protein